MAYPDTPADENRVIKELSIPIYQAGANIESAAQMGDKFGFLRSMSSL